MIQQTMTNLIVYSTDSKEHSNNLDDSKDLEYAKRLEEEFWGDLHDWDDY